MITPNSLQIRKTSYIDEVLGIRSGARDWTRTSTPAKALAPEASASTNFATRATESREIVNAHNLLGLCQTVIIPVFFLPLPWLPAVRGALCRTLQTAGESKDCLRDIRHSSQVQPESSPSTTKQRCEFSHARIVVLKVFDYLLQSQSGINQIVD
jgi:hypothetical protein